MLDSIAARVAEAKQDEIALALAALLSWGRAVPEEMRVTEAGAMQQASIDLAQCPVPFESHRLKWYLDLLEWMAQNPGVEPKSPTPTKSLAYLLTPGELTP